MIEENSKYKVSLGWLREQQRKAKEDGFDNLHKWKYKVLENKYGKEFAVWAIHNKGKIPGYILNAGCKDNKEYRNKLAKDNGFKNRAERMREWRYETGIRSPILENKDCTRYFGEFISQNYVMKTFEDPIQMSPNNPGYDWLCKKGQKIDHKGAPDR